MLSTRERECLAERGWARVEMSPDLVDVVEEALAAWHLFFKSPAKHGFAGDRRVPRGYLPLCRNQGCEMKESFYLQPGHALPAGTHRSTPPLLRALGTMAEAIIEDLEEQLGPSRLYRPYDGCLRVMRYPALSGEPESGLMQALAAGGASRAPEHQDLSVLTLLPAASEPGLEVRMEDGRWWCCDDDRTTLTLLVGKHAHEMSKGAFKAATHRVANPAPRSNCPRLACAYFVG